ncbi:MAG: iron-sulfur cluster assembly protein [Alphaproteobacteria bacterium]|jgi:FeS assembly SUF system protein|nr:iron-sulfur cluster assembly protein [Alphaproteobacteria bacterium]|tara:strand:- start:53 stop:439 length:387 start_codon:yes stop_codon:yes gene_type:complete
MGIMSFLSGELADPVVAYAGSPLPEGTPVATEDAVVAALRTVHDPEIPVDIYELGLIYRTALEDDGALEIEMTLTAPGCPVADILPQEVADAAAGVAGVGPVTVHLVWEPPWSQDMMSDAARLELGMM